MLARCSLVGYIPASLFNKNAVWLKCKQHNKQDDNPTRTSGLVKRVSNNNLPND